MTEHSNVFTVDVEDYFHVQAFADQIDPKSWDGFESRVVENTHRVLRLLDEHQTRGMFFVLGWVAEKYPKLVRDIQKAGHDIGCHSYWHKLVFSQSPVEFRGDLRRATDVIQNITGDPVIAYRAPSFSITEKSLWALDILIDEGYRIDSSIFPIRHDTYGIPNADPAPHHIQRDAGSIFEFPPAVRRNWIANIPVGGGGYFRLAPLWLTLRLLKNINRIENRPVMFYIHPWELDPDQPRIPVKLTRRIRHYRNLHSTEKRLGRLLSTLGFGPLVVPSKA